jgi:hypothetical protein
MKQVMGTNWSARRRVWNTATSLGENYPSENDTLARYSDGHVGRGSVMYFYQYQ